MKRIRSRAGNLFIGILAITAIGCVVPQTEAGQETTKTLYDRLGGKAAITAVVDQFVTNVADDKRINARFSTTDIPRLKKNLVDQVCMASGGPCTYSGRDMTTTHAGMKITAADFNALVEDLVASLNKFKVSETEKKELLGILGPMKKDIVEIP